MAAELPTA